MRDGLSLPQIWFELRKRVVFDGISEDERVKLAVCERIPYLIYDPPHQGLDIGIISKESRQT